VKTDRRDAGVLAEMLAVGSVTEVRIPGPDDEALPDMSRLRASTAKNLAHLFSVSMHPAPPRIRYPKDTRWTQEHRAGLLHQHFSDPALQFTYEADLEHAELLAAHLARIDKQVTAMAATAATGWSLTH
jgi:transposase